MKFIPVTKDGNHVFGILTEDIHVFFLYNFSGDITFDIKKQSTEVYIFGLYLGNASDVFTLNTAQHHRAGSSISDLLIKGIFNGSSKFIYKGLIRIEKNAQKSNAYQKNQNIMLSPDVFVDSRPYLEICANDVRCTHGSTTGQINKDDMFYLETRSHSNLEAKKLILEGFVIDLFDKINSIGKNALAMSFRESCIKDLYNIL